MKPNEEKETIKQVIVDFDQLMEEQENLVLIEMKNKLLMDMTNEKTINLIEAVLDRKMNGPWVLSHFDFQSKTIYKCSFTVKDCFKILRMRHKND